MKKCVWFFLLVFLTSFSAYSNNIQVANVTLTGQNTGSHFTLVQFDLTWDNSFRISAGAQNWDAAWVFVKFQITGGTGCTPSSSWNHGTLSATSADHSVLTNNGTAAQIDAVSDTRGVFLYRAGNGTGSINWQSVKLRWNYGTDGVLDACSVTIKVYAIEMVYVPTGTFNCGDQGNTLARFESSPYGSLNYFQVNSASVPTALGGNGAGSMGNNNAAGQTTADDFNTATTKALPAAYPNGYNKFYCMKYEIGQEQYFEFLNLLTGTQQATRAANVIVGRYFAASGAFSAPQSRNGIKCQIAPVGSTAGQYGSDLNNNGTFNEVAGDGRYIACNFLTAPDVMAYLDWSGLRPMTEMEFEKATRGTLLPNAVGEFAWGNTTITNAAAVSNPGSDNELVTTVNANAASANTFTTGPLRSGVFATAGTTRIQAGGSFYGIMELTGNVWENAVSLGSVAGRAYTGLHGNGALNTAGSADVDFWPGINGNVTLTTANLAYGGVTGCTGYAGMGVAGGSWFEALYLPISERQLRNGTAATMTTRDQRGGGHGIRTAP